jgi:cytoskeletal protein CcmA (bactofilin family)|tara:strand:+ start:139 stop:462 length:324 start_codon:yes stop_codon:yes gene_type:complete
MIIVMSEKTSVLLSDVTISGNIVEKGTLITDSKIDGDITADQLHTHESAKVTGNISASKVTLGGVSKGNVNSDKVSIKSTAEIEGVLNQKSLSVEEGAKLKIKAETY